MHTQKLNLKKMAIHCSLMLFYTWAKFASYQQNNKRAIIGLNPIFILYPKIDFFHEPVTSYPYQSAGLL